jgi:hypothetical protein
MVLSFVAISIQLGLLLQAAVVMTALKLPAAFSTCDRAMKAASFRRQIGCEVLTKLRGIEVSQTVCRFLYRSGLAEVAWKALSVVSLVLSGMWHVSRNVHQSGNRSIRPDFRNYGSPVAMTDKNARSVLLSNNALGGSHVFTKGRLRLLDHADVVAIFDKNVVNAFPARTIHPSTVNQNNIPDAMLVVLRGERTAGQQQ